MEGNRRLVRQAMQVVSGFLIGVVSGFALLFLSFVVVSMSPTPSTAGFVVLGAASTGAVIAIVRLWRTRPRVQAAPAPVTRRLSLRENVIVTASMWFGRQPNMATTGGASSSGVGLVDGPGAEESAQPRAA